ncbi:YlxR family protein [Terrabacter sp. Root85]|uniref:YlxR family protein n=1 Tax=Terrabacter sp. Root85 TaxID=1736603 RepID=UPI0021019DE6|nr:YlxR family protein [Terrabacter sp. Root85]
MGCRGMDSWSALLRVVAATDRDAGDTSPVTLRPDPRHRMPGRGAWLHPTPDCFELAVRRKAFGRALRLQVALDVSAVERHLGVQDAQQRSGAPHGSHRSVRDQSTNQGGLKTL